MTEAPSVHRPPGVTRRLRLEAVLYLTAARLALKFLPFKRLTWFFSRPVRRHEVSGADRVRIRQEVCWAVYEASQSLPGETACFPQAIATQAMLRHRRIGAVLYYGVAVQPGWGLAGHVWVQDGAEGIMGHLLSSGYEVMARYPEAK